jgi:hypothetical protein
MTTVAHRAAPLRHGPRFGMAWVTWRQHRAALAGACGLRALMILYMLVTGLHMRSALSSLGLNTCHPLTGARSATAVGLFNNDHDVWRNNGLVVMRIVALLAGVFTGDSSPASGFGTGCGCAATIRMSRIVTGTPGAVRRITDLRCGWLFGLRRKGSYRSGVLAAS